MKPRASVSLSPEIVQDIDKAILVMRDAGRWLKDTGKNPSKWWRLKNLNRKFLRQYAKSDEFYVALVGSKPAAAAVLQVNQHAQDWEVVDKDKPRPALYIHWLCVHRQFAGKDIPKVIIDFAGRLAKEKGVKLLRADTTAGEMKLRDMYEKWGFSLVGIAQEDYRETAFYQRAIK